MKKLGNTSSAVMQQRNKPRNDGTEFMWIPPCRRALERPSDNTWEVADAGQ